MPEQSDTSAFKRRHDTESPKPGDGIKRTKTDLEADTKSSSSEFNDEESSDDIQFSDTPPRTQPTNTGRDFMAEIRESEQQVRDIQDQERRETVRSSQLTNGPSIILNAILSVTEAGRCAEHGDDFSELCVTCNFQHDVSTRLHRINTAISQRDLSTEMEDFVIDLSTNLAASDNAVNQRSNLMSAASLLTRKPDGSVSVNYTSSTTFEAALRRAIQLSLLESQKGGHSSGQGDAGEGSSKRP